MQEESLSVELSEDAIRKESQANSCLDAQRSEEGSVKAVLDSSTASVSEGLQAVRPLEIKEVISTNESKRPAVTQTVPTYAEAVKKTLRRSACSPKIQFKPFSLRFDI